MKKLISLVLALAMVALCGLAFADNGSITVTSTSAPAGGSTTYEAYRIFDLRADDPDGVYTYTINSSWTGFFSSTPGSNYIVTDNDTTANNGNGYTPIIVDGVRKYIALTEDNIEAFAKAALAYSQDSVNRVPVIAQNTDGAFTGLDLGYYMIYPKGASITPENGFSSIVSLTDNKPNATIAQKATFPTMQKTDDDQSVELGQVVNYTLTSKIPDTTGFDAYTFTFHDQMTDGLTFNANSITVSIDNNGTAVTIPANTADGHSTDGYAYSTETASEGYETAFAIAIPVMQYQNYVGKTITVSYTATVDADAVTNVENNKANLEYSNNPKDTTTNHTPDDIEKVFSAKIVIDKYDGSNNAAKLSGAQFILRCKTPGTTATGEKVTAAQGKYYKLTEGVVSWVDETTISGKVDASTPQEVSASDIANGATYVTTNVSGAAEFAGLENGTYELIEITAPDGYNKIKGVAATITINEGDTSTTAQLTKTQGIANNAGTQLPSTGGIGTTIFYIVGGMLLVGAAIVLVARRKASN